MANDPVVLGIDVGTQSLRAALFDLAGNCLGFGVEPIVTTHPRPGWAEQDVDQWWVAARGAVRAALTRAGIPAERIVGIGLDATACTVVACGADGAPLGPALLWMDQRAVAQAEQISRTGDASLRYVSGTVSPEWMLPKALWLKHHQPETYARAARVVECTDWFMFRLTGRWTLSLNHVTVKWNYARPDGGWSRALLENVGLADLPERWPDEIVPLGKGSGVLDARAAAELGLRAGTPVAEGGVDAYLGMLGLGAVGGGDMAIIMGSSTCHLAQTERPILGSGLLGCYPDATVEGLYTLEGGQTATGSIVDWYRRHFAGHEEAEASRLGKGVYELLDEKAARVPAGAEGLVCLEYWQGNRCPRKDPRARGTIWGMTLAHGPGHLFRAIYEATALGTRHLLEDAQSHGLSIRRLFAGGGGVKSMLWLQIHADVLQQPIHLTKETESCVLGAALVAAVHAGCFPDLDSAARAMVAMRARVEPNPANRQVYNDLFGKYLATYEALAPLMHG